ncbi:MAG TPA: enolase C-terminal domain-like protein [Anaerolineae bacterium]|nr:enolase C-terminal domain-like protein [Anaerolineae bacterium]
MRIKEIRAVLIDIAPRPTTKPRTHRLAEGAEFISPMSRYPEFIRRRAWRPPANKWKRVACVATADDGTWGMGLTVYGGPVARIINDHFAPILVGQNCMATTKLWDLMNRMASPYSSAGLASYAISAVDTALWDLKGKLLKRPVYELLGGPQKDKIFCYASNTNLSYGFEASVEWCMELGFKATKVFLTHGPAEGLDGLRKNVAMVARARDIVGDSVELMVDCWMALDLEYAVRLVEELRPHKIKWVEDCLIPEDLEGYVKLRQRLPWQTLATGEHWYTSYPFAKAASQGLVDILQPDVLWAGGITCCTRICHIAESFNLSVITHAGMNYPYGQHLAYAMPAIPWGERSEGVSPPGVPLEEMVALPGTAVIVDGYLVPSDAPGFGLEVTEEWLESAAAR